MLSVHTERVIDVLNFAVKKPPEEQPTERMGNFSTQGLFQHSIATSHSKYSRLLSLYHNQSCAYISN